MILHLQSVPPRNGLLWVRHGLKVLQRKPIALIGLFGLFALFNIAINFVPLIGQVLSAGSLPLMSLGFMLAAHQVLQAQTPTASVFLQPLRLTPERRRAQLLLGLACALSLMAAGALSLLVDGGALLTLLEMRQSGQSDAAIEAAMAANPMLFFGGLLRMVLLMAVLVPFTLAPALIHWGGQGVMQSLFSSVLGLWRNKGAYALFGVAWIGLSFAGLIVLTLFAVLLGQPGLAQVLAVPLVMALATAQFCSMYFVFIDCFMFGAPRDLPESPGTPGTPS